MKKINIAIDGPSGAGKSTVSQELAKRLDYIFINTGSLYRVIALNAINNKIDLENEKEIVKLLRNDMIRIGNNDTIFLDGVDVSQLIRKPEISKSASTIAKYKKVREYVVEHCQDLTKSNKGYIMDGRDTTFKIMPFAEVKIFLTATPEERAKRRQLQNSQLGEKQEFSKVLEDIKKRDYQDKNRKVDPLHKVKSAIEIDCTNLSFEQVVTKILGIVKEKAGNEK